MATGADPQTIHLLCGLVAAGKTTLARSLAADFNAVRLTRDEWMIRLHGLSHDDLEYAHHLPACTDLMWDTAAMVVEVGRSVILDWNHWSRKQRREADQRARELGCACVVHHLDVPLDVAVQRAQARTAARTPNTHTITANDLDHFSTIFERPSLDEGIEIVVHR